VEAVVAGIPGTRDVTSDWSEGKAELRVRVDPERAARAGLTPGDVNTWVRTAYGGLPVTHFRTADEELDVVLRLRAEARSDPSAVGALRLMTPLGGTVRLDELTTLDPARGPAKIERRDGKRCVTVTANIDEATTTTLSVNRAAHAALAGLTAANPDVTLELGGEFEETQESLDSLFVAFNVALLVILTVLGAQFRSFVQPLVVMFAIPLSFIGVVTGFFVSGLPIDIIGLIGVVGLSGIAVNDSLILVDFINARRRLGQPRDEAIRGAGSERLRPVLLTTVTTVGGLLPLAIGLGGKAERLAPMATAIVWGLSFATLFTLFVIPCLYAIADDAIGLFLRRRQAHEPEWDDIQALDRLTDRELVRHLEQESAKRS
jgi:multidrug efflux pump subunit AcrB